MRDLNAETITPAVISTIGDSVDPRLARVIEALVRHAHAFVREVGLTEREWAQAIDFLTRTGKLCTDTRQEFILLSDVLGITMLVDAVNNRRAASATGNSVLGPFFREDRPQYPDGADVSGGLHGTPLLFEGQVLDDKGEPVAGALVDVWHSDTEGHYDVDVPGQVDPAMRGSFRTDDQGCFTFRSIRPSSYPIPGDGTVGELMRTTARSLMRPAHVHFLIDAPGFQRVTTMLFPSDDAHLDTDPVFGVKQSLVTVYEEYPGGGGPSPDQSGPYTLLRHTFVLAPVAGR
jgi:hydroxyquinol 1,2-dioxygenase